MIGSPFCCLDFVWCLIELREGSCPFLVEEIVFESIDERRLIISIISVVLMMKILTFVEGVDEVVELMSRRCGGGR